MQAVIIIQDPAKAAVWERNLQVMQMPARVIATGGAIASFPLTPFPLGIDIARDRLLDPGRTFDADKSRNIAACVQSSPEQCPVLVATDDTVEGHVIAYDIVELLFKMFPTRKARIFRLQPAALTIEGIRAAISGAKRVKAQDIITAAVQGRAREVTDRWIQSTFTKLGGRPVRMISSSLLGATLLLNRSPDRLRARPETGEITLQARAMTGGRPFVARIGLTGEEDATTVTRLTDLAKLYAGMLVPGTVLQRSSLSAAVAPRFGSVRPFNTADALSYAGRHFGVGASLAMRGLQDAYLDGQLSYPQTEGREMSASSASSVVMLGFACGLGGLEPERLATEHRVTPNGELRKMGEHEALHPVMPLSMNNTSLLKTMVRSPLREPESGWTRSAVKDLMIAIVARRAFEAAREITLEPGSWRLDNSNSDLDRDDVALLADLDWQREQGFNFPWSRGYLTGVRCWSLEAVLLELMASEELSEPSGYTAHLRSLAATGHVEQCAFPQPPRPSHEGMECLRSLPRALWDPHFCRMVKQALKNSDNLHGENLVSPLNQRSRHRVMAWFQGMPEDVRKPLLDVIGMQDSAGEHGVPPAHQGRPQSASVATSSPFEAPDITMAEPRPYGH